MFIMVLRKMLNNKWMILCLLTGSILAVAMVSSIPMYTDGILQRMLTRDLENYQVESGFFPGKYQVTASIYSYYSEENRIKAFHMIDDKVTKEMVKDIDVPILTQTRNLNIDYLYALPEIQREEEPEKRFIKLETLEGLQEHIEIVHGRMFSDEKQDGVYEAIVTEGAMEKLDLRLDEIYVASDLTEQVDDQFRVKIVGVFTIKDSVDPYWFQGLWAYDESFIIDFSLFYREFIDGEFPLLSKAQWYYAFDYHSITLNDIETILSAHEEQKKWFAEKRVDFTIPSIPILEQYSQREKQLRTTLWVLQVPILIMLAFYVFMVSQLIVDHDKNEIAVLKSRGASGLQIFTVYLIESVILSGAALLVGPLLGLFMCMFLGSANGFLEFVQRTALPIHLSGKAYFYSWCALAIFIITMLIPVFISSRTTIVQYKQKKARGMRNFLWKKYFLDVLLLGVAGYGLYSYQLRQETLTVTGVSGTELAIDPLLFIISTCFIIGMGLVFLRIYPYIVRLIFMLGRKLWTPGLYASFIHVGRSGGQDRFLMLFIILTLSIGIFNANAARTLNSNIEEKIRYGNGADITIQTYWESNEPAVTSGDPMGMGEITEMNSVSNNGPVQYREPPFLPYTQLEGVEIATKVFRREDVVVQTAARERVGNVYLMGIIPNEFGKAAWFRDDLLDYHWYQYLNLMSLKDPRAVLVSRSFAEKYKVKKGDSMWLNWGYQGYLEVVVYEFVDYWPTFNPNAGNSGEKENYLVVGNLSYIQSQTALEPYEIWIKKKSGATSEELYKDIEAKELSIKELVDTSQQIILKKNDPMLQGTNGALTLGFIVTMTISTIGFLIYWILSIQKRVLQFGIFRAMGLSVKKVISMLICEQILISGTAIIVGIIIGGVTSDLFVPLLQMVYSAEQQVPPFRVIAARQDYLRIYSIVLIMLSVGLSVLGMMISRIKINQAIKLGED